MTKAQYFSGMMNVNRLLLSSPGRQHNNTDALSRRPCQDRNTEEKCEPECATTLEQVRVTTGSKQSHSVEPNLMNSEILKKLGTRRNKGIPAKWQQIKFLYNCIADKKGKT